MVTTTKNIETVEEKAANCLMLLSRDDKYGGGGEENKRVFRCKTCLKQFSSFQALGGHRARHTKPINDPSLHGTFSNKKRKTTTVHPCPICGVEFPMGQALGGHMRRHRNNKDKAWITLSLLPQTKTTLKNIGETRLESLDFDIDLVNTELELGRTIY